MESSQGVAFPIRASGAERPLFLLHERDGSVRYAHALAAHIGDRVPIYGLPGQMPAERPLRTVEGNAARAVQMIKAVQPAGPYRIAGWGFAGILAFEVAAQLLGRDDAVDFLALLDSSLTSRDGDGTYVPPPIPIPVHHFVSAERDGHVDPVTEWEPIVPRVSARVATVPGTHMTMTEPPHVADLGTAVSRALETSQPASAAAYTALTPLQFGAANVAPVFCIPGAGASATSFSDLARALPRERPVIGFQPRGLFGSELPHSTVEAAAELYLRELVGKYPSEPVHLVGHSFGGWVAFELARRLRAAGRSIASLTIVDSDPPGADTAMREIDSADAFEYLVEIVELGADRSLDIDFGAVRGLSEAAKLGVLHERMVQFGLLPRRTTASVLAGPFRVFSSCLRASYEPRDAHPGTVQLVIVDDVRRTATENDQRGREMIEGWRSFAPELVVRKGAGNHMTTLKTPYVSTIVALLGT
jgi:arthrofactin-type cyclic lipopeptide synthetase C